MKINDEPTRPTTWITQQLSLGVTPAEISNELTRGWQIPDLPFTDPEDAISNLDLPNMFAPRDAEENARLKPHATEILHRLGRKEEPTSIAFDVSARIHLPVERVLSFVFYLSSTIRAEAEKLTGMSFGPYRNNPAEILAHFVLAGCEASRSDDELQEILDVYLDPEKVIAGVEQKLINSMERLLKHAFLLDTVVRIAGVNDDSSRNLQQGAENAARALTALAHRSFLVGSSFSYEMWEPEALNEALPFLKRAMEPTKDYFIGLLQNLLRAPQDDLRQITQNIGLLARLCGVDCYVIGVEECRRLTEFPQHQ